MTPPEASATTLEPGSLRARWAIVLLLGAVLFLPALGQRDLWAPDEARYAQAAREMATTGEWFVPRLGGEIYATKPPLHFWSIALAATLADRWSAFVVRLPAALAAIGTLWVVFELGRRLVSTNAGWFAVLALGTAAKIQWQARSAQIDMTLTLFVSLAILAWAIAYFEDRPRLYPLFWVLAGLGSLAKGPMGLLVPAFTVGGYLAWRRDGEGLRETRPLRGLAICAAILLVWLLPAVLSGGMEYARAVTFTETVVRYVQPWHAHHPWYFYLWTTPVSFLPWSVFLASAVVAGWREPPGRGREAFVLAAAWFVPTLVFLSLSEGKRDVYMVPTLPALALGVGIALERLATAWPRWRAWLEIPLLLVAAGCAAAIAVLIGMHPDVVETVGGDAGGVRLVEALLGALAMAALVAWGLARGGRPRHATGALALGAAILGVGAATLVLPRFDALQSFRAVGERVTGLPARDAYALYGDLDSNREVQVLFYGSRRPIQLTDPAALRDYAAGPGERWVVGPRERLEEAGVEVPPGAALPSPPRWPWVLCRVRPGRQGRLRCAPW